MEGTEVLNSQLASSKRIRPKAFITIDRYDSHSHPVIHTLRNSHMITTRRIFLFAMLLGTTATAPAQDKLPPNAKVVKVEINPSTIDLKTPFEYRQLLLTGVLDNGDRVDVTRLAKFTAPAAVKVSERGQVRPVADGQGEVKFTFQDKSGTIPIKVSGQKAPYEVSFVRDVMPTLSRMGWNLGTCHGSAQGKNGFQLSLRGYDPLFDHRALVDDIGGRRFNRAAPERSLMLMKPTGVTPHVGGVLTQPGEPNYELLRGWIAQGVKLDMNTPRVTKIEVTPVSTVIPLPGMKQQLTVW